MTKIHIMQHGGHQHEDVLTNQMKRNFLSRLQDRVPDLLITIMAVKQTGGQGPALRRWRWFRRACRQHMMLATAEAGSQHTATSCSD